MRDLFDQIMEKPNKYCLLEAVRALEKLTGRELKILPEALVTIGHAEVPELLREEERVLFHFEDSAGDGDFDASDVVIEIFTRWSAEKPVCRVSFGAVYHERGDAYHPLRARVAGVHVGTMMDIYYDSALYRCLAGRDERAASIFRCLWRLQMGPVLLGRDGQIAGALYS